MRFLHAALFGSIFVTGCAGVAPTKNITTKTIDKPSLNSIQREELGNALIEYSTLKTQKSMRVMEQWGMNSRNKDLPSQTLRPIGIGEKFSMFYIDQVPTDYAEQPRRICYDSQDGVFFYTNRFGVCDLIAKFLINSGPVKVEAADYIDFGLPQPKTELIYLGKNGTTIKLLYREKSGEQLMNVLEQEIQYNLSEGNIIGFKGARLEILSSSNRDIEYKVLSKFNK